MSSLEAVAGNFALGVLQAAVVLSRPPPRLLSRPSGWAGRGRHCWRLEPKLFGQPGTDYQLATRPTVVQLRQHDVVYTAAETRRLSPISTTM